MCEGTLPQNVNTLVKSYQAAARRAVTPREFRSLKENFDFLISLTSSGSDSVKSKGKLAKTNEALIRIRQKLEQS